MTFKLGVFANPNNRNLFMVVDFVRGVKLKP